MSTIIDNFLNRITMYRLVLYYLLVLLTVAGIFGFFGILPYTPVSLLFSVVLITASSYIGNRVFAFAFDVVPNVESVYITALILALILTPVAPTDMRGAGFLAFASLGAMASKYILALGKRHIVNPAAFGVALSAFAIGESASWWASGNLPLLPFVVVGGLAVVRKMRRFDLVASFAVVALATTAIGSLSGNEYHAIAIALLHSAFFFLAFVMLTEPLTMPPGPSARIVYGMIVGFLFAPQIHIGGIYSTPELALLVGNLVSYGLNPQRRFTLALLDAKKIAHNTFEFIFVPDRHVSFKPGQYFEWTLGHSRPDSRGIRRYFTIASSPDDSRVRLGVKFNDPPSSFKRALAGMKQGDTLSVSHCDGDFILPKNQRKKLAFIAGGIGVTPFASMVRHLLDAKEPRDIVMLYSNGKAADVAYADIFERARAELGMKTVYTITGEEAAPPGMRIGFIDADFITIEIPDYATRTFYISGPHSMVVGFRKTLLAMGVSRFRIKTDYFPGFA